MPAVLFYIPLVDWVQQTIRQMNAAGRDDFKTWSNYWLKTYVDLGGTNVINSGPKGCPKHAAYGLWSLGRIANGGRAFQNWTIGKINRELGKNAAYAVLALDLLEMKHNWSQTELWSKVQESYQRKLGEPPAQSEQGAIKIAFGLFKEGILVSRPQ